MLLQLIDEENNVDGGSSLAPQGKSFEYFKPQKAPASQSPKKHAITIREDQYPEGLTMIPTESLEPDEIKQQKYINNSRMMSSLEMQSHINEI